ncbi:MAG: hypothetical protein CBC57_01735, partial [Euryarchaeota archaeon TMED97]
MPQLDNDTKDPTEGEEKIIEVKTYTSPENFHWLNGLQEYLEHIKHEQLETFYDIKKAIIHGNVH